MVFGEIGAAAHSVIVASGTLSPLSSFQSELGVPFPITLEASHVIKADQVSRGRDSSVVKGQRVRSMGSVQPGRLPGSVSVPPT